MQTLSRPQTPIFQARHEQHKRACHSLPCLHSGLTLIGIPSHPHLRPGLHISTSSSYHSHGLGFLFVCFYSSLVSLGLLTDQCLCLTLPLWPFSAFLHQIQFHTSSGDEANWCTGEKGKVALEDPTCIRFVLYSSESKLPRTESSAQKPV